MKVAEGNESAFRTIFDRYKSSFYGVAYKMTRSPHHSEEIVQEVFITFWNKRQLVAASRNPEQYFKRILYNSIYAHFRKLALERQLKTNLYQTEEPHENMVEELLLSKENFNFLNTLVSKLPPQQRLVYKLSKQEGLSREEIASRLNISPNTVRNHLTAAIQFITSGIERGVSILIWMAISQVL